MTTSTDPVVDSDPRLAQRLARQQAMRAIAKRLNRRCTEARDAIRGRVVITSMMSRILEHDDEYLPYRPRKSGKQREGVLNPGVFTLQRIAQDLDTTVGDLLGEKPKLLTLAQRRDLRRCVVFLVRLFDLNAPEVRGLDAAITA